MAVLPRIYNPPRIGQLLADIQVLAAGDVSQTKTVNLNGDACPIVQIEALVVAPGGGDLMIRPNNAALATIDVGYEIVNHTATTITANHFDTIGQLAAATHVWLTGRMSLRKGVYRGGVFNATAWTAGVPGNRITTNLRWTNTADTVTSLVFDTGMASGFGIGSYVRVTLG